ncbi:hypothetical protein B1H39_23800 [Serratia marcescens]|uniref:fimbria/pilus periplasmic chaperone n=1 Tax=Serratia marcescens TaxID=615 RepID=UPI0009A5485B|nr:fimbria/pilus periplasmic chaperone [Serratia marcescens]OPJ90833.1 hypothetical protein B1H39_23800 [Serratia marcescens]
MNFINIAKLMGVVLPVCVVAYSQGGYCSDNMETNTQSFSVKLGASRVIFDPASNGTTLTVTNPQDYPMLVQSQTFAEDMKNKAPFVVTPPLMRLDGQQQSRLRIIRAGGAFAEDQESLQWLCVKGIPPKADDEWAKSEGGDSAKKVSLNLQVSINNCIKLLVRPASLKGSPDDAAALINWKIRDGKLEGTNNSAFYMNLSSLTVGGQKIGSAGYIPPFSSKKFESINKGVGGSVQWKIINDYGGESRSYYADLKS